MFKSFRQYYRAQQFYPSLLGVFINPFYIARKELLKNIHLHADKITGITLDIGCGTKPYEKLFNVTKYIGLDLQHSIHEVQYFADVFYDGEKVPIKDEHIDSIICCQVFEHVFEPNIFLSELNRILKHNGKLLITIPFIWDEHEKPFDFARYSSFGIRYLFEKFGFKVNNLNKTASDFSIHAQLLNLYLYKLVYKKHPLLKKVVTFFLMAPVTIIGLLLGKILPCNSDLFLDNIILASKRNKLNRPEI